MNSIPAIAAGICIFAALVIFPDAAASSAYNALQICAVSVIPSLFPFFAVCSMLSQLGLAQYLGRFFAPVSEKLFKVSGAGGTALIVGLTGGYPMGAAYIDNLYREKIISADEANRLIIFCNNSGPAFIMGAVGSGVFSSAMAGFLLYAAHILASVWAGHIFSLGKQTESFAGVSGFKRKNVPDAITESTKNAAYACINVCGFIVFFSVIAGLADAGGTVRLLTGRLAELTGLQLHECKALIVGLFELGNGISALDGSALSPSAMAVSAFILGWGGFSVHFQTFAAAQSIKLKAARYMLGRLVISVMGAAIAYALALIFL